MKKADKVVVACAICYVILVLIPPIIVWPVDSLYELITGIQWQDAVIGSWGLLTYFIFWLSFPIVMLVAVAAYCLTRKQVPSLVVISSMVIIVAFGYGKYALMYS